MSQELLKILATLEKPLMFASKNGFVNIDKVKDLGQLMDSLTVKALSLGLAPYQIAAFELLRESFGNYDELELDTKKELIEKCLTTITKLKNDQLHARDTLSNIGHEARREPTENKDLSQIPIQYLKGVGPRIAEALRKKGIANIEEALYYFPRKYEDRRQIKNISGLKPDTTETVMGRIILSGKTRRRAREIFQAVLSDGTGTVTLVWFQFNEKYLRATYKKGRTVILSGDVTFGYNDSLQIIHPKAEDIEIIDEDEELDKDFLNLNRIVPVYPLTEGIKQRRIRKIIKTVIDNHCHQISDYMPEEIKQRKRIVGLNEALSRVHFPNDSDVVVDLLDRNSVYESVPHRTLSFYEFLLMELGLALKKRSVSKRPGIAFRPTGALTENLLNKLPFSLTSAQKRVLHEIDYDMRASSPMNRLLQGDVGSGKTIVALLSMLKAVESGYQSALMAPTEILAEQHLRSILQYTKELGIRVVLLKSGLSKKVRDTYYEAIKFGEAEITIGTHAVVEEGVEFKNLG
ncbi:MAG: DEAD/DEAH box helicase, partial [Thermodesulfobacteriota bacterium]